jgi:hypothetical protein
MFAFGANKKSVLEASADADMRGMAKNPGHSRDERGK